MSKFRSEVGRLLQGSKARRSVGALSRAVMTSAEPLERRVLFAAVPNPFIETDIGTVQTPGSSDFSSGVFTVHGTGDEIFGAADSFHFVYAPLVGDGNFITQFTSVTAGNLDNALGGIDLRTALTPDAANLYLGVRTSGTDFVNSRAITGGDAINTVAPSSDPIASGSFLKLVRSGNNVSAYTSPNGTTYTRIASQDFASLPSQVFVGLVASSFTDPAGATFVSSNAAVTQTTPVTAAITTNPSPVTVGGAPITFSVTYTPGSGTIDATTLDGNDLTVTGPNGITDNAVFDGSFAGSGSTTVANYHFQSEVANGTYTVNLHSNEVFDTAGTPADAGAIGTITLNIPDITPPTSALGSAASTATGLVAPYTFTVNYFDENQVSASTIGDDNITVTGPGGYNQTATLTSTGLTDSNEIDATYSVPAPTAAGSYTITQASTVTDNSGNPVAAGSLGTFTANLDTGTPTVALTSAPALTAATGNPYQFTVTYTDDNAISASTVGDGDLTVTGAGYTQTATLVSTGLTDGATVVATYSVPEPTTNARYTISMNSGQVTDLSGNAVSAATLGSFAVNIPGNATPAVITGKVITANGVGQAGQTVFLDSDSSGILDNNETSTTTDSAGAYTFANLGAGTYAVTETPASGFTVLQPASGSQSVVAPLSSTNTVNFVNVSAATGTADLTAAYTGAFPSSVLAGAKGTAKVKIVNTGAVATGKPTITLYASSDGTIADATIIKTVSAGQINLKTGKSKTTNIAFNYPGNLVSGSYTIIAAVDSGNAIAESNEANNTVSSSPVTIAAAFKNLSATTKKASPTPITSGKKITDTLVIANSGNVPATGNITVAFYESADQTFDGSDTLIGTATKKINIKNGKSASVAFPFTASNTVAGSNFLVAVVNTTQTIAESDFTNNVTSSATVLPFA